MGWRGGGSVAASIAARNPLDPQDVGLGICAGQLGNGGGVLGDPTCGLSGRMHGVWSPGGPQESDRFQPAGPLLANYLRRG